MLPTHLVFIQFITRHKNDTDLLNKERVIILKQLEICQVT